MNLFLHKHNMSDTTEAYDSNREFKNREQLENLYEVVRRYWPDINEDMINDIINRFNDIIDTIHDKYDVPDHLIKQNEKAYITKRIKSNDNFPTASSINTILSLVTAMLKFNIFYNENKKTLFSNSRVHDFLICNVSDFNLNRKIKNIYTDGLTGKGTIANKEELRRDYWLINDYNIEDEFLKFMSIGVSDLWPYM